MTKKEKEGGQMKSADESGWRPYLDSARQMMASRLSEEHYKTYVTEDRIQDVARWLAKGWEVEVYFEDEEWREDGIGDDITYAGVAIKPIMK